MDDPVRLVMVLAALVFSCSFHECAHVWAALKMGDTTGRDLGRLTLNPIPHIDLFWTLILPLFSFLATGFAFGGPKPAPVVPANMRDPRLGGVLSALAGPASNILLAAAALLVLRLAYAADPDLVAPSSYNAVFFLSFFFINLVLAVANLIPVPPLDGSRFLHYLVGRPLDPLMEFVERSGWITAVPIYLAFTYLFPHAFAPFADLSLRVLASLFPAPYLRELFETYSG
jgi:Zn-dependent protease